MKTNRIISILLIAVLSNLDINMLNIGVFAASLCAVTFSFKFRYAGGAICGFKRIFTAGGANRITPQIYCYADRRRGDRIHAELQQLRSLYI